LSLLEKVFFIGKLKISEVTDKQDKQNTEYIGNIVTNLNFLKNLIEFRLKNLMEFRLKHMD